MDVKRATSIWKIVMNPMDIDMEDVSNIFFDTIMGVENTSYFNAQHLVVDHWVEECEINRALRDDCSTCGTGDPLMDLRDQ